MSALTGGSSLNLLDPSVLGPGATCVVGLSDVRPRATTGGLGTISHLIEGFNGGCVALPANCDTGNWAASSVTDGYGCLWAMPSVCVADAAVFPTSGAHNPTLTIMATTWRNARAWAGVEGPPALPPPAPVGTDDGTPWELLAGAGAVAVAGAAAGAYAVVRSRRRAGEPASLSRQRSLHGSVRWRPCVHSHTGSDGFAKWCAMPGRWGAWWYECSRSGSNAASASSKSHTPATMSLDAPALAHVRRKPDYSPAG